MFEGGLGLEMSKINDGLIAQVFQELGQVKSSFAALVKPVRMSIAASEGSASTSCRRLVMFQAAL
jgi:hypothetical protein